MTKKEKIKKRIDQLPDDLLEQVQKYLDAIKPKRKSKGNLHAIHLKGQYDDLNVRQKAYE